jgi:hypothetical protein
MQHGPKVVPHLNMVGPQGQPGQSQSPPASNTHNAILALSAGPAKAPTPANSFTSPAPITRNNQNGNSNNSAVNAPANESQPPRAPGCSVNRPPWATESVGTRFSSRPVISMTSTKVLGIRRWRMSFQTASESSAANMVREVDRQSSDEIVPVIDGPFWYL